MKAVKVVCGGLAALFGVVSVPAGILGFVSGLAYSLFMIISLIKGTVAVSFWALFKVVLCWIFAGLGGWVVFGVFALIAALLGTVANS